MKGRVWEAFLRNYGASLVVQWLRICLPMQRTRVRALVWEDPTCRGATGPVSRSYWACVCVWSLCSATREAAIVRGPRTAMKSGPHLPQLEKALAQKRRPNTAKNKLINLKKKRKKKLWQDSVTNAIQRWWWNSKVTWRLLFWEPGRLVILQQ